MKILPQNIFLLKFILYLCIVILERFIRKGALSCA